MASTFDGVFNQISDEANNITLGQDINEFVNIFKMLHGGKNVKAMGSVDDIMIKVYNTFLEELPTLNFEQSRDQYGNKLSYMTSDAIVIDEFTSIPTQMPQLQYLAKSEGDDKFNIHRYEFVNFEINQEENKTSFKIKQYVDLDNIEKDYKEFLMEQLEKMLDSKIYTLVTTPIQNIDDISDNNVAFSDEFRKSYIFVNNLSFLQFLLRFSDKDLNSIYSIPNKVNDEMTKDEVLVYNHVKGLHDFFTMDKVQHDDLNSLIVDVMKKQNEIENTKMSINETRQKLYTFMSRDANYTQKLNNSTAKFRMNLIFTIVLALSFTFILSTKMIDVQTKTYIVGSISVLILLINVIMQFSSASREKFTNEIENSHGFTNSEEGSQVNLTIALAHFIDKFSSRLSYEIKNEYYDTINAAQDKDMKILQQLEKENNVQSHFHQLKNNLSNYKINASKEYSRYITYGLILVCIVSMLYLTVLTDTLSLNLFKFISTTSVVLYVTYVLLSVKTLMMRDKYNWDRFHWSIGKISSVNNDESCKSFQGWNR